VSGKEFVQVIEAQRREGNVDHTVSDMMSHMKGLSKESKLSPRINVLYMNLADRIANDWKTIEQIQAVSR